jgi:hypothetical protein
MLMSRRRIWAALGCVLILVALALVRAAPRVTGDAVLQDGPALSATLTPLLPYQGRLVNPTTGQPVSDGEYGMTFALYNEATGGAALWSEGKGVAVKEGVFTTTLGDTAPLDRDLFQGQALWLGIKVQTDAEMAPRQPILPVPYALSVLPGARIDANSADPALTVNNTGAGPALRVEGLANLTGGAEVGGSASVSGDVEVGGTASIAGDAVISGGLWTQGMTMGRLHLTDSGDILSTRGGTNRLSWDKTNNDLELSNTSGDWLDYWYIRVKPASLGGGVSGDGNALANGSTNVVVVDLSTSNNEGAEIHFGQADGNGGWCSVWVQYANGALVGHYLCY